MRFYFGLAASLLAMPCFAAQLKIGSLAGLPRQKVIHILGKPLKSSGKPAAGVMDDFRIAGYKSVRFDYLVVAGRLLPYSARFTFDRSLDLSHALAAAGFDAKSAVVQRSPVDGSTLVTGLKPLAKGWKVSYWTDNNKDHLAHLDLESPDHH